MIAHEEKEIICEKCLAWIPKDWPEDKKQEARARHARQEVAIDESFAQKEDEKQKETDRHARKEAAVEKNFINKSKEE